MKIYNLVLVLALLLGLSSCWIGDQDDPEILYETTIIEVLCQTPEFSKFCEMIYLTPPVGTGNSAGLVPVAAWQLQFAGRAVTNGVACPTNVESVFAPTNDAIDDYMEDFPQWSSIYDIPQDTLLNIVAHHIFLDGKLINEPGDNPECTAVEVVGGLDVKMWNGYWEFLTNGMGDFIARSLTTNAFTTVPIESPDISSTDGVVYRMAKVLGPY